MSESSTKTACQDAAQQLALCIEASPCVKERGLDIMTCVREKDADTHMCEALRTAYYTCRRSQLDMRTRIKGRKFTDSG